MARLQLSDIPLICVDDCRREQLILSSRGLRRWQVRRSETLERRIEFLALAHQQLWECCARDVEAYSRYRQHERSGNGPSESSCMTIIASAVLSVLVFVLLGSPIMFILIPIVLISSWMSRVFLKQAAIAAVCDFFLEGESPFLLNGWHVPVAPLRERW